MAQRSLLLAAALTLLVATAVQARVYDGDVEDGLDGYWTLTGRVKVIDDATLRVRFQCSAKRGCGLRGARAEAQLSILPSDPENGLDPRAQVSGTVTLRDGTVCPVEGGIYTVLIRRAEKFVPVRWGGLNLLMQCPGDGAPAFSAGLYDPRYSTHSGD
ncbi:MAG TPA: hypothetical protein VGR62_05455 [Candidatus Binatia bacterium]|jgi:hypothetical protein|nr:hypothetical protein [Candidatus Binatia bacterium]